MSKFTALEALRNDQAAQVAAEKEAARVAEQAAKTVEQVKAKAGQASGMQALRLKLELEDAEKTLKEAEAKL